MNLARVQCSSLRLRIGSAQSDDVTIRLLSTVSYTGKIEVIHKLVLKTPILATLGKLEPSNKKPDPKKSGFLWPRFTKWAISSRNLYIYQRLLLEIGKFPVSGRVWGVLRFPLNTLCRHLLPTRFVF